MQFLGVFLILIGAFALVDLFTDINLWFTITDFWPTALILYGIYRLLKKDSNKIISYIFIIIGTFIQLDYLGLLTPTISKIIWAVSLIIIGLFLFFNNMKNNKNKKDNNKKDNSNYYNDKNNNSETSDYKYDFQDINSNLINISHSFGEYNAKVYSNSFSGGDITGIFSQIAVDLKDTTPASKVIEVYCSSNVSNIELIIPSNWSYEIIKKNKTEKFTKDYNYTLRIYYKSILGELIVSS